MIWFVGRKVWLLGTVHSVTLLSILYTRLFARVKVVINRTLIITMGAFFWANVVRSTAVRVWKEVLTSNLVTSPWILTWKVSISSALIITWSSHASWISRVSSYCTKVIGCSGWTVWCSCWTISFLCIARSRCTKRCTKQIWPTLVIATSEHLCKGIARGCLSTNLVPKESQNNLKIN